MQNGMITPSTTSSKDDFDFFVGKWQLKNRKLKERLNNCDEWIEFPSTQECYKILNGIGNIDNFLAEFDNVPLKDVIEAFRSCDQTMEYLLGGQQ